MASCSMLLLNVLNIIVIVCATVVIILFHNMPTNADDDNPCKDRATSSMIHIGIFALLVGIIGLLGTCCRSKGLQYIYLWMLLMSSISSVVFFMFIYAMLPKTNAASTFSDHLESYYLAGYKPMLQKALVNDKDWYQESDCFRNKKVCDVFLTKVKSTGLNYIQEGCCKPPHRCGMVLTNTTSWAPHSEGLLSEDEGCKKWAVHGGFGCYDCDECKAGYLGNYQVDWDNNFNWKVGAIAFALVVSGIAYYAIKVDKSEEEEEEEEINKATRILHQRL